MVVWSGKGIFSVLVLVASFFLLIFILPKEIGSYAFFISLFIAAAFSWFMGQKWNGQESRTIIDKASGQEYSLKPNHSLFWIKTQYWGPIFGALGLIILIQELI